MIADECVDGLDFRMVAVRLVKPSDELGFGGETFLNEIARHHVKRSAGVDRVEVFAVAGRGDVTVDELDAERTQKFDKIVERSVVDVERSDDQRLDSKQSCIVVATACRTALATCCRPSGIAFA